jgi:hypothetical protein
VVPFAVLDDSDELARERHFLEVQAYSQSRVCSSPLQQKCTVEGVRRSCACQT